MMYDSIDFFVWPFSRDLQVIFHGDSRSLQDAIGEIIPYKKIFIHPNFTVTSPQNDLMLIKLSVPLTFFSNDTLHLPAPLDNEVKDCVIHTWLQTTDFFGEWLSKRRGSCVLGYIHIFRISEEFGKVLEIVGWVPVLINPPISKHRCEAEIQQHCRLWNVEG